jgi:hypothetical protein
VIALRAWLAESRLGRRGRFAWLALGWLELWVADAERGYEITVWLGQRRWIIRRPARRPTTPADPGPL